MVHVQIHHPTLIVPIHRWEIHYEITGQVLEQDVMWREGDLASRNQLPAHGQGETPANTSKPRAKTSREADLICWWDGSTLGVAISPKQEVVVAEWCLRHVTHPINSDTSCS